MGENVEEAEKSQDTAEEKNDDDGTIRLASFLETHAPGSSARIADQYFNYNGSTCYEAPSLQLHCAKCGGLRVFSTKLPRLPGVGSALFAAHYLCRNCNVESKTYALRGGKSGPLYKIGEYPPYGPPVPARLVTMVGPDRELFLKGRRAENLGLGVGAFAYYRRVVEAQWHRIVDQILRVAETTGASEDMLETLKRANTEQQFSRAVDLIKQGIPDSLKIGGENPLKLLYAALSEGIHDQDDASCLELAGSVRVVLAELAERIGVALQDERELQDAVARLRRATGAAKSKS